MDLSNRYPSKYYKSKSQFTTIFINIGIIVLVLLGIYFVFMRGGGGLQNLVSNYEHTEMIATWLEKSNIKYTKIKMDELVYSNEGEHQNTYHVKVTGYQDSTMSAPKEEYLRCTFSEFDKNNPRYILNLGLAGGH